MLRFPYQDVSRNIEYIIHAHNEYNKFINNKNSCFLNFTQPAGLRKLGHVTPSIPELREELPQIYTMKSYFLMHFEGSLFPTCDQVNKLLKINFNHDELNNYNYYFALTLTALHIFCYLYENNKIYMILEAINHIIFINRVILRNSRMTPGVLKTL